MTTVLASKGPSSNTIALFEANESYFIDFYHNGEQKVEAVQNAASKSDMDLPDHWISA